MRRRWVHGASLGVSAAVAVVGALVLAPGRDDPKSESAAPAVELAGAVESPSEPVDGTVPTTPPLDGDDDESMCPGLELDPELIPPPFETDVYLIPDPEPFEICLLLERATR